MTSKRARRAVILFAGDSGDGVQFTGNQFTRTTAHCGNDLRTFPDFPAEIRAPQGTTAGVSGFQIHFGSEAVLSPGYACDTLVAFNAAALKNNIHRLKSGGILIANASGFDRKNLSLAEYGETPLTTALKNEFECYEIDISALTRAALKGNPSGAKVKARAKNMFALGFVYWLYHRDLSHTESYLNRRFHQEEVLLDANLKALQAGYHYGETIGAVHYRFQIAPAEMEKGRYRNTTGNQALALGLIAAAHQANLGLYYAGYPITPASGILHFLSQRDNYGVTTFQAEDEIAAISAAIGAAFGGSLAVTASSGPGIALKAEAMALGVMLELPLVIVNVQRGGPSTGLPTKTEQSDLMQALYGRNGEAPLPVLAAKSPVDCFYRAFEAAQMAMDHMTPVILLSDAYLANGSEPWRVPTVADLPTLKKRKSVNPSGKGFLPYLRDENLVRDWAIPGQREKQHRIGGLEKAVNTGCVSYEAENHQNMVAIRRRKVELVGADYPKLQLEEGDLQDDALYLSWGSTYGTVRSGIRELRKKGKRVAHLHLTNLYPLPADLKEITDAFEVIYVPELNDGQLSQVLKSQFLKNFVPILKIKGQPFTTEEIANSFRPLP